MLNLERRKNRIFLKLVSIIIAYVFLITSLICPELYCQSISKNRELLVSKLIVYNPNKTLRLEMGFCDSDKLSNRFNSIADKYKSKIRKALLVALISSLPFVQWNLSIETIKSYYLRLVISDPDLTLQNFAGVYLADALGNMDTYKDQSWALDVLHRAAENANPWVVLSSFDTYKDQPWALDVLRRAAENANPFLAFLQYNTYKDQPWALTIIEAAAEKDPREAIDFSLQNTTLLSALGNSQKPAIKKLIKIINSNLDKDTKLKIAPLLHKMVFNNLSIEDAVQIVSSDDPLTFFRTLIDINRQPGHLGEVVIDKEISKLALHMVQKINSLHNETDEVRFASLKDATASEFYTLIVYGEEELYFTQGFFNHLFEHMSGEGINGYQLLERVSYGKFRTFLKICASSGRLEEFLKSMPIPFQTKLLNKFMGGIDSLEQAATVADALDMIVDKSILKVLHKTIKQEYERHKASGNKEGEVMYGLLAGMCKGEDNEWFKNMAKEYKLPDLNILPASRLFNGNRVNVQQYFFYNDGDGKASFKNLLSQYRNKSEWDIEAYTNYIIIKSKETPYKIEIYANKPDREEQGTKEIEDIFEKNKIIPTVIVHRGHSFYTGQTIENIKPGAAIIFLGSCGGYKNNEEILKIAPESHIIATKGKGTMWLNDPLLKMLNDFIRSGKDINWQDFWLEAAKKLIDSPDFKNYIPPHENMSLLYIIAYNRYTSMLLSSTGEVSMSTGQEIESFSQIPYNVLNGVPEIGDSASQMGITQVSNNLSEDDELNQIRDSVENYLNANGSNEAGGEQRIFVIDGKVFVVDKDKDQAGSTIESSYRLLNNL